MGSEIKLIFNAVMVGSQARWVSARLSFFFSVPVSLFWFTSMQSKSYALQKTFFYFYMTLFLVIILIRSYMVFYLIR